MIEDDLMKEIRAAKDAYARSFGYDLRAIVADLQAADARKNWPLIRCSPPDGEVESSMDGRRRPRVVGVVGPIDGSGRKGHAPSTSRDISIPRGEIATPSRIEIGIRSWWRPTSRRSVWPPARSGPWSRSSAREGHSWSSFATISGRPTGSTACKRINSSPCIIEGRPSDSASGRFDRA